MLARQARASRTVAKKGTQRTVQRNVEREVKRPVQRRAVPKISFPLVQAKPANNKKAVATQSRCT